MTTMTKSEMWLTVVGLDTPEQMIREAESQSITPQGYIRDAIRQATEQGATLPDDTFEQLCRMADIEVG